jgi:hypothetical protein
MIWTVNNIWSDGAHFLIGLAELSIEKNSHTTFYSTPGS